MTNKSMQHETSNGSKYPSWKWLAVTLIPFTIGLAIMVYKLTNAQTNDQIQGLGSRVSSIESSNVGRDSKIETVNQNIIRICNKLDIPQCR